MREIGNARQKVKHRRNTKIMRINKRDEENKNV